MARRLPQSLVKVAKSDPERAEEIAAMLYQMGCECGGGNFRIANAIMEYMETVRRGCGEQDVYRG